MTQLGLNTEAPHLVSIAKSSIIQKYGPDKILEPFMADVKELEKVYI